MKTVTRTTAIAALSLLAAGNAGAATTLYTAPASPQYTNQILSCRVTNVSATPRHVEVQVRNYAGVKVSSVTVVVPPGATDGGSDGTAGSYCKFVVLDGSAKHVHASANYMKTDGAVTTVVPAQ
jgi:hypothetical protein